MALFEFYEGFLGCVEEQVNRLHEQFKAMDQRLTDVKYNHQTQVGWHACPESYKNYSWWSSVIHDELQSYG